MTLNLNDLAPTAPPTDQALLGIGTDLTNQLQSLVPSVGLGTQAPQSQGLDALGSQMQWPGSGALKNFPGLPGAGGFSGGLSGTATSGTTSVGPGPTSYNGPIPHSVVAWENTFSNGRIPSNAMRSVSNGEGSTGMFMPVAARAYDAMMQAAARQGVHLAFGGSYRDYATQVATAQSKGLYSQGGLAAVPGTSEHGWGLAADMDLSHDPRMLGWLQQNASHFGFHNIPREPWHWQWEGGYNPPSRTPQRQPTPQPQPQTRPQPQPQPQSRPQSRPTAAVRRNQA